MCVLLCGEKNVFFFKKTKTRVSLWLGVCIYTYGYIYINADDDDILGHFLFWSAVFLFIWKGNNTFDGKIIVTWLKIARLCGCWAHQGHNIYDVRSRPPDWCTWVRWFFFLLWTKFVFPVLLHFKQEGTGDFHEWCRCSIKFCSYSFVLFCCFERLSHCDDDVMSDECCIIFVRLCTSQ